MVVEVKIARGWIEGEDWEKDEGRPLGVSNVPLPDLSDGQMNMFTLLQLISLEDLGPVRISFGPLTHTCMHQMY